jgi:hypothetical protein
MNSQPPLFPISDISTPIWPKRASKVGIQSFQNLKVVDLIGDWNRLVQAAGDCFIVIK